MKILIFYASYGGGHLSAANGIKEEIQRKKPNCQIEMIDCMEYLSKPINYITVKSYEGMAKRMPKTWGKVYKASRKGAIAGISNSFNKMYAGKLLKLINKIDPNLIISTHPFSNQMCAILKKKKLTQKIYSILTDFKYHEQWLVKYEYINKFFCSNEKMRQDLITYGIDKNKVIATGLPISEKFSKEFDKEEILKEFNLKNDKKVILFFAGGRMGLARKNIFDYMEILVNKIEDIQVVAISGKNQKIYNKFKEIAKDHKDVKVIEFTKKIPELMSVSSMCITKPRWNNKFRSNCFSDSQYLL